MVAGTEEALLGQREGQMRKGPPWRRRATVVLSVLLGIGMGVVVMTHQADILDLLAALAEKFNERKYDAHVIIGALVISSLLSAIPLPGKFSWFLGIGFMYKWFGLPILVFGRFAGSSLAFLGARHLWSRRWPASCLNVCRSCCACCSTDFEWAKLELLVQAIEDMPFKTILLLTLGPAPLILLSYVLGAKAPNLRWWRFIIPMTLSGVKLALPIFYGSQLKRIHDASLSNPGGSQETNTIVAILGIVCGITAAILIGYACRQQLNKIEQQYTSSEAAKGPTSESVGCRPDAEAPEPHRIHDLAL